MGKKQRANKRRKNNRRKNKSTQKGTKVVSAPRRDASEKERRNQAEDAKRRVDPKSRYYQDLVRRIKELNLSDQDDMDLNIDNLIFLLYEYGYRISHLERICYQLLYADSLTNKIREIQENEKDDDVE